MFFIFLLSQFAVSIWTLQKVYSVIVIGGGAAGIGASVQLT